MWKRQEYNYKQFVKNENGWCCDYFDSFDAEYNCVLEVQVDDMFAHHGLPEEREYLFTCQ